MTACSIDVPEWCWTFISLTYPTVLLQIIRALRHFQVLSECLTSISNRVFVLKMMSERPITQHGLSGLPTSHGRIGTAAGMRQIKDKRYWQAQLQVKMNEITKEIERLSLEQQVMNRERSAKRSFEKKVKAAAKELTSWSNLFHSKFKTFQFFFFLVLHKICSLN